MYHPRLTTLFLLNNSHNKKTSSFSLTLLNGTSNHKSFVMTSHLIGRHTNIPGGASYIMIMIIILTRSVTK